MIKYFIDTDSILTGSGFSNLVSTNTGDSYTYSNNTGTSPVYVTYGNEYPSIDYSSSASISNSAIESLRAENEVLKGEVKVLKSQVEFLMSEFEKIAVFVNKDAKVIKLSDDDKMFSGILDDMLKEDD